MSEVNEQSEYNPLVELEQAIQEARQRIANEYARTGPDRPDGVQSFNTWLNCFGTVMNAIYGNLQLTEMKGLISEERYTQIEAKYKQLEQKRQDLLSTYNANNPLPPENIQNELFEELAQLLK